MNAPNTPTLITERLILRKFTEKDIKPLYDILKDEQTNEFLPWFPPQSLAEAREFYEKRFAARYEEQQAYAYAVCLKSDNVPIGYLQVDMEDGNDLGYGFRSEFWNCGYASEAAKAVIGQAKKDGLLYITATHDINNPASGKVMRKIGMKYRYSYEEWWQPKNFPVIFRMYQLNLNTDNNFVYMKYWNMYGNHFTEKLP